MVLSYCAKQRLSIFREVWVNTHTHNISFAFSLSFFSKHFKTKIGSDYKCQYAACFSHGKYLFWRTSDLGISGSTSFFVIIVYYFMCRCRCAIICLTRFLLMEFSFSPVAFSAWDIMLKWVSLADSSLAPLSG